MKTVVMKNNFSAGELAPALYTRTDIQQYSNGARRIKNLFPLVEGGVRKRPGTFNRGLMEGGAIRLIPFIVNSANVYLLIFNHQSITVYDPRNRTVITTLVSPYTTAKIRDIQYVQYRFEMFLTHNGVPMQRLRCDELFSNWNISEFVFTHPPIDSESARYPFRKGKPSGKDLGAFVNFTLDVVSVWDETQTYLTGDVVAYLPAGFVTPFYYQAATESTGKRPDAYTKVQKKH